MNTLGLIFSGIITAAYSVGYFYTQVVAYLAFRRKTLAIVALPLAFLASIIWPVTLAYLFFERRRARMRSTASGTRTMSTTAPTAQESGLTP